jgi:hypothetical protein
MDLSDTDPQKMQSFALFFSTACRENSVFPEALRFLQYHLPQHSPSLFFCLKTLNKLDQFHSPPKFWACRLGKFSPTRADRNEFEQGQSPNGATLHLHEIQQANIRYLSAINDFCPARLATDGIIAQFGFEFRSELAPSARGAIAMTRNPCQFGLFSESAVVLFKFAMLKFASLGRQTLN